MLDSFPIDWTRLSLTYLYVYYFLSVPVFVQQVTFCSDSITCMFAFFFRSLIAGVGIGWAFHD